MEIRKAVRNDLPSLSKLFNGYRIFYGKNPDYDGAKKFLEERMAENDSEIYVSDEEGELSGFVQLYPLFSSTRMKKFWILNDLFVEADHRGKGISIKLIARAKQLVRETRACGMFLETGKTNDIGNSLYPKTGFQLNETANFYEWEVDT